MMNQQQRHEPISTRIALTSTGPLSGKSTLARYLRDQHGFVYAEHVRTLVEEFVMWYNRMQRCDPLTVSEVFKKKEQWRVLLQEYGNRVGFNDTESTGTWIERTLVSSGWTDNTAQPVVFDSLRGEVQAAYLRKRRFLIVQLDILEVERKLRAAHMGKDYRDVQHAMEQHPELERGVAAPDVILHSMLPVDMLADLLRTPAKLEVQRGR